MTQALEVFVLICYCIQTIITLSLFKRLEDLEKMDRMRKIKKIEKDLNELKGTEERINKFIKSLEDNK